jgi:hypothetical protein
MLDRMSSDPVARRGLEALGEHSALGPRAAVRACRATPEKGPAFAAGTPPLRACGPAAHVRGPPNEEERSRRRQRQLASDRSRARRSPTSWLAWRSGCGRSPAAVPKRPGRSGMIAVPAQPNTFMPCGQRLCDRRKPRRRLLEGLSLQVDNAPSPVRGLRGRESEDVHGVLLCVSTRTGGPTMTSRRAAASDRMIGHEGSNSEPRMLNFADRGWA